MYYEKISMGKIWFYMEIVVFYKRLDFVRFLIFILFLKSENLIMMIMLIKYNVI